MEMRKLGHTDIDVSLICLGTMTWGSQNVLEEGHEQMNYAVENGINFFDTAELYAIPPTEETYGRTETIIGEWFAKTGKRDQIILASKVAGPTAMSWIRGGSNALNAENISQAIEGSLARLKTDYIDLYQLHWPDRPVNSFGTLDFPDRSVNEKEEDRILATLEALSGLVKQGKIRHVGLSNETPWGVMQFLALAEKHNLPRMLSVQNPYSLLNRTYETGLAEVSLHTKCGLLAYSPLAGGVLSGKYLNGQMPKGSRRDFDGNRGSGSRYKQPGEEAATQSYVDIAKKYDLDACQMALAFVNQQPFVTSNIIGATSMEQLKTNIASVDVTLSADVMAEINAIHTRHANPCP